MGGLEDVAGVDWIVVRIVVQIVSEFQLIGESDQSVELNVEFFFFFELRLIYSFRQMPRLVSGLVKSWTYKTVRREQFAEKKSHPFSLSGVE